MPYSIEHDDARVSVQLQGDVSVADAAGLHEALCALAPSDAAVTLDDSGAFWADTAIIQLVLAFARARRDAGRPLGYRGAAVQAQLARLGLEDELLAG